MRCYRGIVGPDHTWRERRSLAIAMAMNTPDGDPPLPDRGPCLGRVFMVATRLHLPGWPRPLVLLGLVPKSLGGVRAELPSWDSLQTHYQRREKRQNRLAF